MPSDLLFCRINVYITMQQITPCTGGTGSESLFSNLANTWNQADKFSFLYIGSGSTQVFIPGDKVLNVRILPSVL